MSRSRASQPSEVATPFGALTDATIFTLEEMNVEGLTLLREKQKELQEYTDSVAKAEEYLAHLQTIIQSKTSEFKSLSGADEDQQRSLDPQLAELASQHQEQVRQMKAEHDAELTLIRRDFAQTLEESRQWAARHCEIALQEKLDEAARLKAAVKEAKGRLNETTFVKHRAAALWWIDTEQVARLEQQISELTAITREEIRDACAKIDECVAAIELRRTGHARELQRLENEAAQRSERYDEHLAVLREQYELESTMIEQKIAGTGARAAKTEQIIERLERHHEAQLKEVLGDMETMKKSSGLVNKKNRQQVGTLRQLIKQSQDVADQCRRIEEEMQIIDQEVEMLNSENRELSHETDRLAAILQRNGSE
jgi:hypothetical protein